MGGDFVRIFRLVISLCSYFEAVSLISLIVACVDELLLIHYFPLFLFYFLKQKMVARRPFSCTHQCLNAT